MLRKERTEMGIGDSRGGAEMCRRFIFIFKQKTAYEVSACLVGSEMCVRDRV